MRFLLIIREDASPIADLPHFVPPEIKSEPEYVLKNNGYQVFASCLATEIGQRIKEADAVVLHLPIPAIAVWVSRMSKWKSAPLFWWCSAGAAASSLEACEEDIPIDGILTPSMSAHELHWALHFGVKNFFDRRQWLDERAQLVSRLEERKWIDLAKGILCDLNRISEAEAYDVLRKRAMNERKRIVDIATSIVKAHQQLKA
ncbi:ANTAR domain-containing protein [Paenibacillus sp. M1]|uniref:ANTAR domain-containing protein n=1 Tax=Paenibacillus haidiansis TaxID=1574488 RepID=A0ABU7VV41_9BACL